jgi:hypothetical protein
VDASRFHVTSEHVVARLPRPGGFILGSDGRILVFPMTADPVPPQLRIAINWPQDIARRIAGGK